MKKRGKPKTKRPVDRLVPPTVSAVLSVDRRASPEQTRVRPQDRRLPVGLSWSPRTATGTVATPFDRVDDRRALALLLVPFLIVAVSLVMAQSMRPTARWLNAARPVPPTVSLPSFAPTLALAPLALPTSPPQIRIERPSIVPPNDLAIRQSPLAEVPLPAVEAPLPPVASLNVPTARLAMPLAAPLIPVPTSPQPVEVCHAPPKQAIASSAFAPADFGLKLAEAAEAQTKDFVIYSAAYKRIAYPMGDIPSLYGACSDLVIRAYRSLGVDLQEMVQRARVGGGDTNIDHRRTETLRTLFARHGDIIPPSTFPEDYKPGDIVTYYRPYSRVSRAHIAIVSDRIGSSGQPMIVHNRGWGPQLEDALFVDRITGHYRFDGALRSAAAAKKPTVPSDQVIRAGLNNLTPSFVPASTSVKSLRASVVNKIR